MKKAEDKSAAGQETTDEVTTKTSGGPKASELDSEESPKGKATFYLWADALTGLVEDAVEETALRLKSAVLEAWVKVKDLSNEDERDEALHEHSGDINQWHVDVQDGAAETDEAAKLKEIYEARQEGFSAAKKKNDDEKADDDEDEDETQALDDWWWELTMQRGKPAAGVPALAVKTSELVGGKTAEPYNGDWWVIDLKIADGEGAKAIAAMGDHLASSSGY